ncbi:unnamed protein product [Acanthocheilonema viteae]|uniref:Ras-related protein Rab n=1 Tax=Acanthocheilonema viteae TaxID=6277 RepID=A0A498SR61_ACAVI|nr:unnamed protein product [Acanthocheilonema viteae]
MVVTVGEPYTLFFVIVIADDIISPPFSRLKAIIRRYSVPSTSSSNGYAVYPKDQFLFKILIIGDVGTGKSSIVQRYAHNLFTQHYKATVGVDFATKNLSWNDDITLRLQLWDISG